MSRCKTSHGRRGVLDKSAPGLRAAKNSREEKNAPSLVGGDVLARLLLRVRPVCCPGIARQLQSCRPHPLGPGAVLTQKAKLHGSQKPFLGPHGTDARRPVAYSVLREVKRNPEIQGFRMAPKAPAPDQPNLGNRRPPGFYYITLRICKIF